MKIFIQVVAIIFMAHLLAMFLPWYCIAIAPFILGYLLKSERNFLAGFLAIAILWMFNAWLLDASSSSDLPQRVAMIFSLQRTALLYLLMGTLGGLVGGFAALTGSLLRK